jgi:hypothetical protein
MKISFFIFLYFFFLKLSTCSIQIFYYLWRMNRTWKLRKSILKKREKNSSFFELFTHKKIKTASKENICWRFSCKKERIFEPFLSLSLSVSAFPWVNSWWSVHNAPKVSSIFLLKTLPLNNFFFLVHTLLTFFGQI